LTKGERALEAPTQGEAMTCPEAATGVLSGRGFAKRGDVTTSRGKQEGCAMRGDMTTRRRVKRQWHVKRLWRNEKPCDSQPTGQVGGKGTLRGDGIGKGIGRTVATNGLDNNQLKSGSDCNRNSSHGGFGTCGNGGGGSGRSSGRHW
jgi:hypothetical protein